MKRRFLMAALAIGVLGAAYTPETIAPEMMGKVFSLMMTAMTWSMPVGLLFAGPVSELIGIDRWFFWSGFALIVTGLACRLMTRRYDAVTMLPEKSILPD